MTPRPSPSADTQERLVEEAVILNQRLEILTTTIEQAVDEFRWALRNCGILQPELPFMMPIVPKHPDGPHWNERIETLNKPEIVETVGCDSCDIDSPPSIAAALQAGWRDISFDPEGTTWNYLGTCPGCIQAEEDEVEARSKRPLINEPPLEKRIDDHQKWGEEVRDPARESSEGIRELKVPGAEANYEIGRTKSGKWAVSLHASYTKGDCSGKGNPWEEYETRQECVERFLQFARRHFSGNNIQDSQKAAQKAMLRLLEGEGLFGFVEPEPTKAKPHYISA